MVKSKRMKDPVSDIAKKMQNIYGPQTAGKKAAFSTKKLRKIATGGK